MGDPLDMGKLKGESEYGFVLSMVFTLYLTRWGDHRCCRFCDAGSGGQQQRAARAALVCAPPCMRLPRHLFLSHNPTLNSPTNTTKGIFEWSMKYQDGSRPTDYGSVGEMPKEKREWLEAALKECMVDLGDRMKQIKSTLDGGSAAGGNDATAAAAAKPPAGLAAEEELLDELADIVASVDYARDLSKVGGLPTLLSLLACPYPSLRWRAAEVAATCMANNPPVQRAFDAGGAGPALLALLGDADATVRAKGLHALSAMARHYDPGLDDFLGAGGVARLLELLGAGEEAGSTAAAATNLTSSSTNGAGGGKVDDDDEEEEDEDARAAAAAAERRLRRKALGLLAYAAGKRPAAAVEAAERGAAEALSALLEAPTSDSDLRAAALGALLEIASSSPESWRLIKARAPQLAALVARLQQAHSALSADERDADAEEGAALDALAQVLAATSPPPAAAGGGGAASIEHIEVDGWEKGAQQQQNLKLDRNGSGSGGAGGGGGKKPTPPLSLPAPST
jgi:hsp70-interacting protein